MEPPKSAEVVENENSKYWFDEGLLYVVTKKAPELPLEEQKKRVEDFKKNMNGKKVCAIMDVSDASSSSRESREYNAKELPSIFKAIAFISKNAVGRMFANIYFGIRPLPLPVKIFSNEKDAREWITQFVH